MWTETETKQIYISFISDSVVVKDWLLEDKDKDLGSEEEDKDMRSEDEDSNFKCWSTC